MINREDRKKQRSRQNKTILILAIVAVLVSVAAAWNINHNNGTGSAVDGVGSEAVVQQVQATSEPVSESADLPAMTGEQCAAAGATKGMSATWGAASDGCWLISQDGRTIVHVGTWKE